MLLSDLVDRILGAPTIDEAAQIIEHELPPEAIDTSFLEYVRSQTINTKEPSVLRGLLVSARFAPLAVASVADTYGLWLASSQLGDIRPELMRVATWAYRWAGDEFKRARVLVNLSEILFQFDDFVGAQHYAAEAHAVFEQLSPDFVRGIGKSLMVQALVFYEQQCPELAQTCLLKAFEMLSDLPIEGSAPSSVQALTMLGMVAEDLQDNFDQADAYYRKADDRLNRSQQNPSARFRLHLNQGFLQLRLGRHADARFHFDTAASICEQYQGDNGPSNSDYYGLLLAQITQALMLNDIATARHLLTIISATVPAAKRSSKQHAEIDLYTALLLPPSESDYALTLLAGAADQFKQLHIPLLTIACQTYLAERSYLAGQVDLARTTLAELRAQIAGYTMPRRQLDLERIAAQYDSDQTPELRADVARRLSDAHDYIGAAAVWQALGAQYEREQALSEARHAYANALVAVTEARGFVRLNLHNLSLLSASRRAFDRLLVLMKDESPEQAFTIVEQMRAQVLLDEITNAGVWRLLDHAELAEIHEAFVRFEQARARASLHLPRTRQAGLRDEPEVSGYHSAEQAYFAALDTLQNRKVMLAGWIRGEPRPLAEICATLPEGSLLAAYSLIGQADGTGYELWITTLSATGKVHVQRATNAGEWQDFSKRWEARPLLQNQLAVKEEESLTALNDLYAAFVLPLQNQLDQSRQLIVVFDECLSLYPIHAAYYRRRKTFLIERLGVSYAPSGSILAAARDRRQGRTGGSVLLAGWDAAEDSLPTLDAVPHELERLASMLNTNAIHGPLSPNALFAHISGARIIHLSCHGDFPEQAHPRFANLVLGPQRLYADDVYRATLDADLVFLNACDSGKHGHGLQGLVSAALVAGASSVIAAMWKVEQSVGCILAERFYRHWQAGLSFAEALRRTQCELIAAGQHPAHWAPFYLTGLPDLY